MSQYKGRIQRLNVLKGRMLKKLKGLKISILPINTQPKAEIKPLNKYRATWDKGISFGGMVKRLNAIFRFLSAKDRIINKHEAKAISAPAVDVKADSAIQASEAAQLAAHPAKEIAVNQKPAFSVSAKLVAYRRAGLKYIKQLFFKRKAELTAAPGTAVKYAETVKLNRTSKAIAAESAIMESRFNKVQTGSEAAGSSAPAHIVPAIKDTVTAKHTATASTGTAVDVNVDSLQQVTHSAKMATWIDPVVVDGVLILRQVYSATKEKNILVVE